MEFASEKWGGVPHYRGDVRRLGEDGHGSWWWGRQGRSIFRGDVELFVTREDVLFLAPPDAWWNVAWWVDHPEVEVYVNIGTPVVEEADRLVSIDLDLDVIRRVDGTVLVLDRDEFDEHQVLYGYPMDVVETVEAVTEEVRRMVERAAPPFDAATARRWIERARST